MHLAMWFLHLKVSQIQILKGTCTSDIYHHSPRWQPGLFLEKFIWRRKYKITLKQPQKLFKAGLVNTSGGQKWKFMKCLLWTIYFSFGRCRSCPMWYKLFISWCCIMLHVCPQYCAVTSFGKSLYAKSSYSLLNWLDLPKAWKVWSLPLFPCKNVKATHYMYSQNY